MSTKKDEVRGREIAVLSLWHWRLPTGIFTCDGAVACSSWSMASCSFWVPSGYAQCLSSVHAPGCLEATLGHAKLDLINSASQQGLLSWPHSRSPHASSSRKELPCVEPAGPASALNSYWPAEGHERCSLWPFQNSSSMLLYVVFLPFGITSSEEAFLLSILYEWLFHDFSFKQGTGMWGGKGQLVRLSEGWPNLQRGVQASLLDSCFGPQHGWPWKLPCAALLHLCCHQKPSKVI